MTDAINPDFATTREGTNDQDERPKTPAELGADAASSDKPDDAVPHESDAEVVDTTNPNAQAVLDALGEGWSFGDPGDTEEVAFTNGDITVGVGSEHLTADNVADIAATIAHAASVDPETLDEGDTGGPEGDDEDAVEDEEREDEEE